MMCNISDISKERISFLYLIALIMQPLNPNPIPNFPPNSHLISIKLQESAKIKIKNAKKKN
jgi:hypothetical protein